MWYDPETTKAVEKEPVSILLAKQQCRADIYDASGQLVPSVDDSLFETLITHARDHVEKMCNRFFAEREIEAYCDSFSDLARFEVSPVKEVLSITYTAPDGTDALISVSDFEVRKRQLDSFVVLKVGKTWPAAQNGSRIKVTMKVGETDPSPMVVRAMLLLIGAWYENREETVIGVSIGKLPGLTSIEAALANERRFL